MRPSFHVVRLLVVAAAAALGACRDTPTATVPVEPVARFSTIGGPPDGCALLDVTVRGSDSIVVAPVNDNCGALRIVTNGPSYHNRVEGRLRLDLAIENVGTTDLVGPALLALWQDSSVVVEPAGLPNNPGSGGFVQLLDPDSVSAAGAPVWPGASLWFTNVEPDAGQLPAGLRQRFSGLSVEVAIHDGDRRIQFRAQARADEQASIVVPDVPPDSVPAHFRAVLDPKWHAPIDLLAVIFHADATTEERNAAAAAAGAIELAGGTPLAPGSALDGIYLFRIATDGTMRTIFDVSATLSIMPGVVAAFATPMLEATSKVPDDGSDWNEWRVDPNLADGRNMALELVAAPLAWGCTVGSTSTNIAVIDQGFRILNDLSNIVNPTNTPGPAAAPTRYHGAWVTSILAAKGDNGTGMTGMMWDAAVSVYDPGSTAPLDIVASRLQAAVLSGAHVVNLSMASSRWVNNTPTAADEADFRLLYTQFGNMLDLLDDSAPLPLIVVTAGNEGLDAKWAGFPLLAERFQNNVIVVAASENQRPDASGNVPLWSDSGVGTLVDITAPGENVRALDQGSVSVLTTGTSSAAPLVAGTAGLLKSFDPSIAPAELKALIVEGAVNGGRTGGSYPFLNAYEALRLAAQRPGAPLCGNRVAADEQVVMAERSTGWENLLTMGATEGVLNVFHGGRSMDAYLRDPTVGGYVRERFELQNGAWTSAGVAPTQVPLGVADGSIYNSSFGTSHDADSTVLLVREGGNWFDGDYRVVLVPTDDPSNALLQRTFQVPLVNSQTSECVEKSPYELDGVFYENCSDFDLIQEGEIVQGGVVWMRKEGYALLWITRGASTRTHDEWIDCELGAQCRELDWTDQFTDTEFFEFDLGSGTATSLFSVPYAVRTVAVSEDGGEIMIERMTWIERHSLSWEFEYRMVPPFPFPLLFRDRIDGFDHEHSACAVDWVAFGTGQVRATSPFLKTCYAISGSTSTPYTESISDFIGSLAP